MEDWRVYYGNGTRLWGSRNTPIPENLRTGVIAVAEKDPDHNWIFLYGKDWYLQQNDGHWMGVDQTGLEDQIVNRIESIRYVLKGRTLIPHSEYQKVIDRMIAECKPPKTGSHSGELT